MTTHFRTCSLCEAMCGLAIEVEGGRIASIKGDPDDPFSRGFICPKGVALQDLHEDPDRLRKPMLRSASGWREVSWDEALDEAASGLHRVQAESGRDAVASYLGNPTVHDFGALIFGRLLLRSLGSRSRFSATSVDQLPHHVAAFLMFGHGLLLPIPDVDRTGYFLILGANPIASNGSLMTAPGIGRRLEAIRQRDGKVVVVDPRRTETAAAASEHVFIRPGTDALFLLALVRELIAAGPRMGRLAAFADGLDALTIAVEQFTPERAATHTSVPAETTRRLARELAEAGSAACYGRVGASTQPFGGLCQWLVNLVNVLTGNLDRPGGAMFPRPAFDLVDGPRALGTRMAGLARRKTRVRGLPDFAGELPVAVLAEEILTPGPGQIRGLITLGGNPILSTPNGAQLDRALASLAFQVSVDPYLNETSRHAHVILPPATPLERGHYDIVFHALAVRNTAKYSPPLFPRPDGSLADWEILLGLIDRLARRNGRAGMRHALTHRALARLGPEGILDIGLRFGPHGSGWNPFGGGLSLKKLRAHPHGLDLGALEPCLPGRLKTPGKRIVLAPAPLLADLARLREAFPAAARANGDLRLIGRRNVRDNNSWMHNLPRLMRGKPRCTLLIHPDDASARGLADGETADVSSRAGSVSVTVSVTDDVMRGVVCLPHGYGHAREGVRLAVASSHAGASLNDLTDELVVDALTGTAAFSGVPVRVEKSRPG